MFFDGISNCLYFRMVCNVLIKFRCFDTLTYHLIDHHYHRTNGRFVSGSRYFCQLLTVIQVESFIMHT